MELYVYSSEMELQGIVEKIASLIWTRRYWSCGEFKLLVPFTEEHSRMLVKNNIIMKRGDDEAAQIRYVSITKNSRGLEEIEVQGKFLIAWIGKRIIKKQVLSIFSIPFVLGLLDCFFASAVYKTALMQNLLGNRFSQYVPVILSVALTAVIYAIYYWVTIHTCYKSIFKK